LFAFWTILTASLTAVTCALLGCYLVLRKIAMVSDAISHSILPGILFAFFITGSRDSTAMLMGAAVLGLLTTVIIEFLHRKGNLQSDAAIGVTFTALFALGVILVSAFAEQIDLDTDCVLYGEIAYTPLDVWFSGNTNMGPKAVWVIATLLLLVGLFISLSYKELLITSFDPAFSAAIGMQTQVWHYLLIGTVSLTTVAAFESVGAILVVALLICPAATAYLLSNNLKMMLCLAALFGVIISIGGYYLALILDGSIAGAMSAVAGVLFALAFGMSKIRSS
jgi:manganese/zinc/iron transport system permease protein